MVTDDNLVGSRRVSHPDQRRADPESRVLAIGQPIR